MSIENWFLNYPNCCFWWVDIPHGVHLRYEVYFTAKELYLWRLKDGISDKSVFIWPFII